MHRQTNTLIDLMSAYSSSTGVTDADLIRLADVVSLAARNVRTEILATAFLEFAFSSTLALDATIEAFLSDVALGLASDIWANAILSKPIYLQLLALGRNSDADEAALAAIDELRLEVNTSVRTAANDLANPARLPTPRGVVIFDKVYDHTASDGEVDPAYFRIGFEPKRGFGPALGYSGTRYDSHALAVAELKHLFTTQTPV